MKIAILDDYQDTIRTLRCFTKVSGICVPHLGYVEQGGLEGMFSTIFDQMLAYATGKPINVSNPAVLASRAPAAR